MIRSCFCIMVIFYKHLSAKADKKTKRKRNKRWGCALGLCLCRSLFVFFRWLCAVARHATFAYQNLYYVQASSCNGLPYILLFMCRYIIALFTSFMSAKFCSICISFCSSSFICLMVFVYAVCCLLTVSACTATSFLNSLMRMNGITEPVRN